MQVRSPGQDGPGALGKAGGRVARGEGPRAEDHRGLGPGRDTASTPSAWAWGALTPL